MTFSVVARGLRSPEGPVVLPDGSVAVVESMASRVSRVLPDGTVTLLAETGDGPNGMTRGRAGELYVANNGGMGHPLKNPGRLQRIEVSGTVTDLVVGLEVPNDVCVAADGSVWFTDPCENWFGDEEHRSRVLRFDPATGTTSLVHEGLRYANGLGFDPEGTLVVAESRTGWLHRVEDGVSVPWLKCPTGAPDGFCFDTSGRVVVCCFDAHVVYVFEGDSVVEELRTADDEWPTNCALTPEGSLVVTESAQGRLLRCDLGLMPLMEVLP